MIPIPGRLTLIHRMGNGKIARAGIFKNIWIQPAAGDAGGTAMNVQVYNITTGHDMLSTPITIDAGELTSGTAAAAPVVNATYKNVGQYTQLGLDVDAVRLASQSIAEIGAGAEG